MKKRFRPVFLILAVLLCLSIAGVVFAAWSGSAQKNGSKYEKVSTNSITTHGGDPAELSVSAASQYFEKEWYEYITYNEKPVSSYRIDDNCRMIFYDPYDYMSSMIMDVTYDDSGWGTANSISVSHTFSKTFSYGDTEGSTSSTATQKQEGKDETGSTVTNSGTTTTEYNHQTKTNDNTVGGTVGTADALEWVVNIEGSYSHSWTNTDYLGKDTVTYATKSETKGWTKLADRVTTTTGSSSSTNRNWSSTESKTITKTYNAAYFNSSGSPLSWTIAYYEVKMPMKYAIQYRVDDEWVSTDTGYCVLTTIQGACRAWRENTVTYYEHWGTGEPVADTEFWGQFFTKEQLLNAYQNKLYPSN